MGAGIAAVLLAAGDEVALVEESASQAVAALARVDTDLAVLRRCGPPRTPSAGGAEPRLAVVDSISAVPPGLDVAIEAVPERRDLKQQVLADLESLEPQLLGSNTSSLSIGDLGQHLRHPERFLGLHFFNPVRTMPLLEVVIGRATGVEARGAAEALAVRIGKEPMFVRDAPGFVTSRLGVALGLEAIRLVEEGVAEPKDIDRAMELGYRHRMGPLRLTDLIGLDVRLDIARSLEQAYGPRFTPPDLLVKMVADGRLGRKSGAGFYEWTGS